MRSATKVSVALVCAVAFLAFGATRSAHADICFDRIAGVDSNGTPAQACGVALSVVYDGDLFAPRDTDFYAFDIKGATRLTVSLQDRSLPPECVNGWLYNAAATFLTSGSNCGNGGQPPTQFAFDITQTGVYYLQIGQPAPAPLTRNRYQFQLSGTGVPAAPTNLYATPVDGTTIRVQWTANSSDQTRFDVEGNGLARTATASPFDWTGETAGSKVCFRVRAVNGVGASAYYPDATPSGICATTPNAATGTQAASGGTPPSQPSATRPPPPAPANRPPAPPPTVVVVPGAPVTIPGQPPQPERPSPAPRPTTPKPKPKVSRQCLRARAAVRRLRIRVRNDRAALDEAATRRRRARIRARLRDHRDGLAVARQRARRRC